MSIADLHTLLDSALCKLLLETAREARDEERKEWEAALSDENIRMVAIMRDGIISIDVWSTGLDSEDIIKVPLRGFVADECQNIIENRDIAFGEAFAAQLREAASAVDVAVEKVRKPGSPT